MTATPAEIRTTWSIVRATCRKLDIDIDKVTGELNRLDELAASAATVAQPDPAVIGAALVACVEAGADPFDDRDVIRAAVACALAGRSDVAVATWANARRVVLLGEAAPAILTALRDRVTEAQKIIANARKKGVPSEALASRNYALRAELETPAALARQELAAAEAAVSGWRMLADGLGLIHLRPSDTAIIAAPLTADQLDALGRDQWRHVTAVAVAGHDLDLPTGVDDLAERMTRLRQERAAADEARAHESGTAPNMHRGAPVAMRVREGLTI